MTLKERISKIENTNMEDVYKSDFNERADKYAKNIAQSIVDTVEADVKRGVGIKRKGFFKTRKYYEGEYIEVKIDKTYDGKTPKYFGETNSSLDHWTVHSVGEKQQFEGLIKQYLIEEGFECYLGWNQIKQTVLKYTITWK